MNKKLKKENFVFYFMFVVYLLIFMFTPTTNDDVVLRARYVDLSLSDHWQLIVHDYFEWSSRVIVNAVVHVVLGWSIYVWVLLNAIVLFIMMRALSELFVEKNDKAIGNIVVASAVAMYSFPHMGSAGWVTTSATYLWPLAFGFVALIPIKKYMNNEKVKWWEGVIYGLALIYSANEELELVVILLTYSIFGIYMLVKKQNSILMCSMVVLSYASAVFTLTAPGNGTRSNQEIDSWFREYRMLNSIDKIDLGFTSTLQEVLFGRYPFFMLLTAIMVVVIWKQYGNILVKMIPLVPFVVVSILGVLKYRLGEVYEPFAIFTHPVSNEGLVTLDNSTGKKIYILLLVYIFIACMFIASIYFSIGNSYLTVMALCLLVAGTGGRTVMGFSPTVWASGNRTYSTLLFAIIAILIIIVMHGIKEKLLSKKEIKVVLVIMIITSVVCLVNTSLSLVG